MNAHLTALLVERHFYSHVNLSFVRYHKFQSTSSFFRLNEIESLIIDCYASPLQLKQRPHLQYLKTLIVKGVRQWIDVFNFAKQHANTLRNLTIVSNGYFSTCGMSKNVFYPSWNLCDFIRNVSHHLPSLRSLDFGIYATIHLHDWSLKTIHSHLTYLRITLVTAMNLFHLMMTDPLSSTLQQLHITFSDVVSNPYPSFTICAPLAINASVTHFYVCKVVSTAFR
ncbi:unnamed protein product [Adineta ricciae]|uniref:Uncharacterized protein n=1 Tax=Adineta ricciae TaxID=249248 RepID=A0A816B6J4_ADIRI|nr:unnamed protein product [Adineta ricciae]